jgi:hypothetical protein
MDELRGVDRVDHWLNAQRGWRRYLLCWLQVGPAIVWIGVCVREVWAMGDRAPAGPLAFGAASALIALPVACLLAVVSDRRARRSPGTAWPLLSWRAMTWGIALAFGGAVVEVLYGHAPGSGWARQHRHDIGWGVLAFTAAFLAMTFIAVRGRKRKYLARPEDSAEPAATTQWPPRLDAL